MPNCLPFLSFNFNSVITEVDPHHHGDAGADDQKTGICAVDELLEDGMDIKLAYADFTKLHERLSSRGQNFVPAQVFLMVKTTPDGYMMVGVLTKPLFCCL